MIIKDPKQKKRLDKIPERDKNGDPIFKIASPDEGKDRRRKEKKAK